MFDQIRHAAFPVALDGHGNAQAPSRLPAFILGPRLNRERISRPTKPQTSAEQIARFDSFIAHAEFAGQTANPRDGMSYTAICQVLIGDGHLSRQWVAAKMYPGKRSVGSSIGLLRGQQVSS